MTGIAVVWIGALIGAARAHGGEDHGDAGHGAGGHQGGGVGRAATVQAGGWRVPLSSEALDAVLVLPGAGEGAGWARLMVADATTNAPAEVSGATLSLVGPGSVNVALAMAEPGVLAGPVALAAGDWAGSLVVERAPQADLFAVGAVSVGATDEVGVAGVAGGAPGWGAMGGSAGWIGAGVGLALFGAGFGIGRRAGRRVGGGSGGSGGLGGVGAGGVGSDGVGGVIGGLIGAIGLPLAGLGAGVVGEALQVGRAEAHGGEDHGPGGHGPGIGTVGGSGGQGAAPSADAGAGLTLRMESQFLIGLRTERIVSGRFQAQVAGLGALLSAPGGAATIRAPVAGILEGGAFPAPGSAVRAGERLSTLRETPSSVDRAALVGQRAEAEARLAEARAALRLAQRDLEQMDGLGAALPERARLERRNAAEVAAVAVREAERAVAAGGLSLSLLAPIAGRIAVGAVRPGDQVAEGEELFRIVSDGSLWVRARVPEAEAIALRTGGEAVIELPGAPGWSYPAVVLDQGIEADPRTGTVMVTLALTPETEQRQQAAHAEAPILRPGMAATAWIGAGPIREVLTVPDDAVVESGGVTLVFVKVGPERFEVREVRLGARSGHSREVLAGLRPSERVVVAGTYALRSVAGR